jgi:inhibitor of cysteine peptidase
MKKILLVLLCFLGISTAFAGTMPVVPVSASQRTFIIQLPTNPSTGYMWTVKSYDKKLLKFLRKKYVPAGNKILMGAGGYMNFYFRVCGENRPQHTEVGLLYSRPWEKGSGEITPVTVVFTKK